MTDDLTARLAEIDIFHGFSSRALRRLAESGREVEHEPGHEVAVEGKGASAFHYVLDGSAEVDVHGEVRSELRVGDYFGEISLVDGGPRSATVRAGEGGLRTFALAAFEFRRTLEKHPESVRALLVALCARLRTVESSTPR